MERSMVKTLASTATQLLRRNSGGQLMVDASHRPVMKLNKPSLYCDVFINHRGLDTKRTFAGLLYNHLRGLGLNPFLDKKSMKPGDCLYNAIESAIRGSKVGVAVFSPNYGESYFCLHELALLKECNKKIVPFFCDVKPSELHVVDDGSFTPTEFHRFQHALEETKYGVGLTFDTSKGDWSEFLKNATDRVVESLMEAEEEQQLYA